jgi:hypothetical protein
MPIRAIDEGQRKAAKIVGLTYLLVILPAVFAEFAPAHLIVADNAVETAHNIIAHERLFRLGIASNLIAFGADAILIAALYIVLSPVNRGLALLATFWRLIETSILIVVTLDDFNVVRVLSADYMGVFEPDRLAALARLSISAHSIGYNVGLTFAGLGSTVFAYLWLKSGYVPKALAAWGIFSSLVLAACTFTFVVYPELWKVVTIGVYGGPIFIFEITMGFWLVIKGIPPYKSAQPAGFLRGN